MHVMLCAFAMLQAGRDEQARGLTARFEALWASADPDLREAVVARYGN